MMINVDEENAALWAKVCEELTGLPTARIRMSVRRNGQNTFRIDEPMIDPKYKPVIKRLLSKGLRPEEFTFQLLDEALAIEQA